MVVLVVVIAKVVMVAGDRLLVMHTLFLQAVNIASCNRYFLVKRIEHPWFLGDQSPPPLFPVPPACPFLCGTPIQRRTHQSIIVITAGLPRQSPRAEGRASDRQLPGHEPSHLRTGGGHGAAPPAGREDRGVAQHFRPQVSINSCPTAVVCLFISVVRRFPALNAIVPAHFVGAWRAVGLKIAENG